MSTKQICCNDSKLRANRIPSFDNVRDPCDGSTRPASQASLSLPMSLLALQMITLIDLPSKQKTARHRPRKSIFNTTSPPIVFKTPVFAFTDQSQSVRLEAQPHHAAFHTGTNEISGRHVESKPNGPHHTLSRGRLATARISVHVHGTELRWFEKLALARDKSRGAT